MTKRVPTRTRAEAVAFAALIDSGNALHRVDMRLLRQPVRGTNVTEIRLEGRHICTGDCLDLTERDRKIMVMVANGQQNGEIAHHLGLAESTVKNLMSGLLGKLQVEDRTQLAVFAIRSGLAV